MLIDCDIHVTYRSIKELIPYADAHTRELVDRSGVAGLSMPTYPWVHPSGLDPARHLRCRGGRGRLDVPGLHARAAARARARPVRRRLRPGESGRGGLLLRAPELAPRRRPRIRVQRLASRHLAAPR